MPSYPEFMALISLRSAEKAGEQNTNGAAADINEQILSILDVADQAMRAARKEWDATSKTNAQTARCMGNDWWRGSVRNVVKASIAGNIAVATAKRASMTLGARNLGDLLTVEMPGKDKRYHPWWVVPVISIK